MHLTAVNTTWAVVISSEILSRRIRAVGVCRYEARSPEKQPSYRCSLRIAWREGHSPLGFEPYPNKLDVPKCEALNGNACAISVAWAPEIQVLSH